MNRYKLKHPRMPRYGDFGSPCEWAYSTAADCRTACEAGIQIDLRCRAAQRAHLSVYPSKEDADRTSLAPSRRNICLTFQVSFEPLGQLKAATYAGFALLRDCILPVASPLCRSHLQSSL